MKGRLIMRMLDLALKDLARYSAISAPAVPGGMPILFTLFMGYAYEENREEAAADTRILLGWVNPEPGGVLRMQRSSTAQAGSGGGTSIDEVKEAVQAGDVAGALVVPVGFSEATAGEQVQLKLVADTATPQGHRLPVTAGGHSAHERRGDRALRPR